MKKIGIPKQIVESFSILFGVYDNATEQLVVDTADNVLSACCANDCSVITGYLRDIDDKLTQIEGLLPIEDRIIFAQLLLKHGLIGEIEKKKKSENADYSDKFHAKEFVYMAVAHLGMSDTDA